LVADIFNLDKGNILPARMEDMPWKAKRPKNFSLNNDTDLRMITKKPITVAQELTVVRGLIESDE